MAPTGLNLNMVCRTFLATLVALLIAFAAPDAGAVAQTPARAGTATPAVATGRISGRVLDGATGEPVRGARVRLTGAELPGGRAMTTDASGAYAFAALPAGRFTVTASKAAYIAVSYGQRRPLQPGTPLQLRAGDALERIDIALPRGSVIAGVVRSSDGDVLPGTTVRILRYQYVQGDRQLVPAGSGVSDDRGQYRIWGLNPGEYYITATAPAVQGPDRADIATADLDARANGPGPVIIGTPAAVPEAYAPTYYPGVASARQAQPVAVGLGAELLNIDFDVLLVPVSRIVGRVIDPRGGPARGAAVALRLSEAAGPGDSRPLRASIGGDGTFEIERIPPGSYILSATAEIDDVPAFAVQSFDTGGGEVADLSLFLAPGATLSGTAVFEASGTTAPPPADQLTITAPSTDRGAFGGGATADIDPSGTFTVVGVPPGGHWLRADAPPGWTLKSVVIGGRESIDAPFEVRGSARIGGIQAVFTNRIAGIRGTVMDRLRNPVADYTVLAFSADAEHWRPQSRYVMTARPDQNGRFQLEGLPPGDYLVTTIDPEQQGEWYDPRVLAALRDTAQRLTLADGEQRSQDLVVSAP